MCRKDVQRSRVADVPSPSIAELEEEEQDAAIAQQPLNHDRSYCCVEWSIVFSKTYRIPQLCFNVYDTRK